MVVQKDPIEFTSHCRGSRISTLEGVSRSEDTECPFQIEGVRWHFLETLAGPRLGDELLPFVSGEAQLQRTIHATGNSYSIAWKVLRAAQHLYGAKSFLGGTAVTAPPFFEVAGRLTVLYWHLDPACLTCEIGDDPLVMALADFTDHEFEAFAPSLRRQQDWDILTPPVPNDSKKRLFLEGHGHRISTGQGKIFREKGWWMSGHDNLASYSTKLDAWVPLGQSLDAKLISMLTGALQDTASNDLPFLVDSTPARLYRAGTEMGLLGLHSSTLDIYESI